MCPLWEAAHHPHHRHTSTKIDETIPPLKNGVKLPQPILLVAAQPAEHHKIVTEPEVEGEATNSGGGGDRKKQ